MSGDAYPVLEVPPALPPEMEEKARRKTREIINEALISARMPLENRRVVKYLLPGIWYASITVLLNLLDRGQITAFLHARYNSIHGFGDNADSPARELKPVAMKKYKADVQEAAETIMDKLMIALERLEALDLDDRFPEAVFEAAVTVLMPAWGPDHVKRAISEQMTNFIQGRFEIRNFMEPVTFVSPPKRPKRPTRAFETDGATEKALADHRVRRAPGDRQVICFAATERLDDSNASWAMTMRITSSSGRREHRDIFGVVEDRNGNRAISTLVHELALALCMDDGIANVDLRVTDPRIVQCFPSDDVAPVEYIKFEDAAWKDIAACFARHTIVSRVVDVSLTDEQQERCDKLLKNPFAQ